MKAHKASRIMNSYGIMKIPCYRSLRHFGRVIGGKTARLSVIKLRRELLKNLNLSKHNGVWRKG